MTKDWQEKALIQDLRQAQRKSEQIARYYATVEKRKQTHRLAQAAQGRILGKIQRLGYTAYLTTHKAPFDAWIAGCKAEFKASNWQTKGRRYQAHIKNHQADIVIFDAINGMDHYFIIPMAAVAPRKTIEITRFHVSQYQGQWAQYLERWDILQQAVEASTHRSIHIQLTFLDTTQLAPPAPER